MKKQSLFFFIGLIYFLCQACEKPLEKDETNPKIIGFTVNGATGGVVVQKNDVLNIVAQFQDDKGLEKFRVKIEDKFYGSIIGEPFSFEEVKPVTGLQANSVLNIQIPDSTLAGHFDVVLEVMDKEGNISIPYKIGLQIAQPNLPTIGIELSQTDFLTGDTLPLSGLITIPTDLDLIYFDIVENQLFGEKVSEEIFSLTDEIITKWGTAELSSQERPIIVPTNAKRGNYFVNIAAYDSIGNMSLKTFGINVEKRVE